MPMLFVKLYSTFKIVAMILVYWPHNYTEQKNKTWCHAGWQEKNNHISSMAIQHIPTSVVSYNSTTQMNKMKKKRHVPINSTARGLRLCSRTILIWHYHDTFYYYIMCVPDCSEIGDCTYFYASKVSKGLPQTFCINSILIEWQQVTTQCCRTKC